MEVYLYTDEIVTKINAKYLANYLQVNYPDYAKDLLTNLSIEEMNDYYKDKDLTPTELI